MGYEDSFLEAPPPKDSGRFDLWLPPDAVIAAMAKDGDPVPTGWAPLDRQLRGGGIRPGRVVGIGGPAWTGKTTIIASIALHVAQRIPVYALFSDEGRSQAATRMGVQLGVSLSEIETDPAKASKEVELLMGERHLLMVNPASEEATAASVVAYAREKTPPGMIALIVYDSIQTIRIGALTPNGQDENDEDPTANARRMVKACRKWADETKFIFLLASWVTRESYKWKKRADNVHKLASFFGGAAVEHCLDVGVCLDLPGDDEVIPVEVPKNRLYRRGASRKFAIRYDEPSGRMLEVDAPDAEEQRVQAKTQAHEKTVSKLADSILAACDKNGRLSNRELQEMTGGKTAYITEAVRGLEAQGVLDWHRGQGWGRKQPDARP